MITSTDHRSQTVGDFRGPIEIRGGSKHRARQSATPETTRSKSKTAQGPRPISAEDIIAVDSHEYGPRNSQTHIAGSGQPQWAKRGIKPSNVRHHRQIIGRIFADRRQSSVTYRFQGGQAILRHGWRVWDANGEKFKENPNSCSAIHRRNERVPSHIS